MNEKKLGHYRGFEADSGLILAQEFASSSKLEPQKTASV
jgi:hypothetical protein